MAGWISSKLKVAETFLQQIDQQAAESLGKNERPQSPSQAFGDEIQKRIDTAPPLKFQLPKRVRPPETSQAHSDLDSDTNLRGKAVKAASARSPDLGIADGDWTELLSSPNPISPVGRPNESSASHKGVKKPGIPASSASRSGERRSRSGFSSVPKSRSRPEIVTGGENVRNLSSQEPASSSRESSDLSELAQRQQVGESQGGNNVWVSPGIDKLIPELDEGARRQSHMETVHKNVVTGTGWQEDSHLRDGKAIADGIGELDGLLGGDSGEIRSAVEIDRPSVALGSSDLHELSRSSSGSDGRSDEESDSASTSDSEAENERRLERRKRRERIMAEKAAAMAVEVIRERENIVARLEGEKQSLERMLVEREKQQEQEASELQTSMIETMEAVDLEKQKHNSTRMEAFARLAKLETINADLARALAASQWNLEVEVNRVAEIRQQIELKELAQEEHKRRMSRIHQRAPSLSNIEASKRAEYEKEIIDAEYSFVCDKIWKLKDKAKKLEENIEMTREIEHPTEVEVELKKRLAQLTDQLIQKQTQVEALSSEKATLVFRIETVTRLLDENGLALQPTDLAMDSVIGLAGPSVRVDIEAGIWEPANSKLRPAFRDKIRSGQQRLGSFFQQLDAIFYAGAIFLRRNPTAQLWSLLYLLCLHLWVMYILMSHSPVPDSHKPGAIFSIETINRTLGS